MSKIKQILIVLGVLLLGALIGRFTAPVKLKETERIVYKERTESERKVDTRITKLPNGTIITDTNVTELILEARDGIEYRSRTESKAKTIQVALYALKTPDRELQKPAYGVHAQYEVLPSISVGILGDSARNVGVSVGFSF